MMAPSKMEPSRFLFSFYLGTEVLLLFFFYLFIYFFFGYGCFVSILLCFVLVLLCFLFCFVFVCLFVCLFASVFCSLFVVVFVRFCFLAFTGVNHLLNIFTSFYLIYHWNNHTLLEYKCLNPSCQPCTTLHCLNFVCVQARYTRQGVNALFHALTTIASSTVYLLRCNGKTELWAKPIRVVEWVALLRLVFGMWHY